MVLEHFAVFEGIDGAGTTTQINLLKERVSREETAKSLQPGLFAFTAEPAQTPVGVFIRNILSGGAAVEMGTLAYLFAADRFEHVYGRDGIVAAHNAGKIIVSDRYFFSSLAYQGPVCGALPQKLNEDFPLPSLLFFFDIDVDMALSRISSRKQKEIFETKAILQRTAAEYRRVIERWQNQPEASRMNVIRIDASLPPDEIHHVIWSAINSLT